MRAYTPSHDKRMGRDMSTAAILTLGIVIGSWFVVPAPRWALVTLGATATLLMLATIFLAFPLPRRINIAASITTILGHVISLALTLDTPPTLSAGDPPGRMLSSFAIQSPSHAIRYRVPFPRQTGERMRVKMVLAQPYEGLIRLRMDISGQSRGIMHPPEGGNLSELEYAFDMTPFRAEKTILLTIRPDAYDTNLRLAIWKSGLGRQIPDEPEYLTEYQVFRGLPDPLTGAMTRFWPLIWVTSL
ncbi:MAG: hypothetical protein JW384_02029 [Nitrosomonadaceae bacterium]|nr:hypothetical protein [Nitrosomonadaceae bacterium]